MRRVNSASVCGSNLGNDVLHLFDDCVTQVPGHVVQFGSPQVQVFLGAARGQGCLICEGVCPKFDLGFEVSARLHHDQEVWCLVRGNFAMGQDLVEVHQSSPI